MHLIITKCGLMGILASSVASKTSQLEDRDGPKSLFSNIPAPSPPPSTVGSDHHINTQDALTLLAMYLSAIIHDYDHRGVTNPFLIQDEDPLAVSARSVDCV